MTEKEIYNYSKAEELLWKEFNRATDTHAPQSSAHEGYAILLEEVDELWDEVKLKSFVRSPERMRTEAIQVAAMAMRFVVDITGVS